MDASAPILLFDSGVGGLTVLAELRKLLPQAPVIYAADTAGLPYGSKTEAEIAARVAGRRVVVVVAIAAAILGFTGCLFPLAIIAALIIWLHRANIRRLMRGEEPRVGSSKSKADAEA